MAKYPMREFLRYANLSNYDQILQLEPDVLETSLENWIMDQDQRGLKGSTIRTRLSIVETFLDMNRVVYHKRILSRLIPKDSEELGGSLAFTHYEIRAMLDSTKKIRTKALIHLLASTGIRPGALIDPILTIKHLKDMPYGCKAIKVYDQSKEGYWTFLTPEATKALNQYLTSRKLNGECLNEDSPIFANIYDSRYGNKQNLSDIGLRQILYRALKASGISRTKSKQRFDKAVIYGFRKRFNTILKLNNNVNSNITEKLMAHKRGLDGTYLTPTLEECFAEFVKAIPDLTLDETERQKIKIEKLEEEKSKLENTKLEIETKNEKIKDLALFLDENPHILESMEKIGAMIEKFLKHLPPYVPDDPTLRADLDQIRI